MAESQKEDSSSVNSKQKKSLLDLDFGKDDFMTSWKSMSINEDDAMSLDFGPVSKGKKNAFKFDKADMDFNLDLDFGKLPSFNLDIPDIDISSPVKKDGKSKGRSNEESATGNTRGKADRTEFTFDFGEFDGFNFKTSSKKNDLKVNKDEIKENSSCRRVSQESRDCQAEDLDVNAGGKFSDLPASGDASTSNLDSEVDTGGTPDCSNENRLSKSRICFDSFPNSTVAINEAASHEEITMLRKTTSASKKETNCQQGKSISPKPLSQEVCFTDETMQDESVHKDLRNESGTLLKIREEASPRDAGVSNQHIARLGKDNKESEVCTDNHARIANEEGTEPALGGSFDEPILSGDVSRRNSNTGQMNVRNEDILEHSTGQMNARNEDILEHSTSLLDRATDNNMMPEKERETVTRSKYFKQRDNTDSRVENASCLKMLSTVHGRVIGTKEPCPLNESSNCNSVDAEIDDARSGAWLSSSAVVMRKEHSQQGSQENSKCLNTNRILDQHVIEGMPASRGGEKNVKAIGSFSLLVKSSSLSGMTKKPESQNSANPANLAVNLETSQTTRDRAAEGDKVSLSRAIKQVPALSTLTTKSTSQNPANSASFAVNVEASHSVKGISTERDKVSSSDALKHAASLSGLTSLRSSGANLDSSKSVAQKEIASTGNMQQCRFLVGSTRSQAPKVVESLNQMLPVPSLKRKTAEDFGADVILKPSKRVSDSPINENSAETGRLVDREACGNENFVDGKSLTAYELPETSKLDVSGHLSGLNVPFSVESNINIEEAEACAKELEDICNMLRKKHEEAKELLVRAIVSNNKLLMLNHPIYEEKIRIVQKFAMQLTIRDIQTPT